MALKIFASNINHLTDARYFASRGATWMCYNIDKLSLTEIAAIKEWVEGPKHIINVIDIDPSEASAMLSNDAVDGYLTNNIDDYSTIQNRVNKDLEVFFLGIAAPGNHWTIQEISPSDRFEGGNVICDIKGTPKEIEDFITINNPDAIFLQGGEEEEVGVKSFEELDEVLDLLEDILISE